MMPAVSLVLGFLLALLGAKAAGASWVGAIVTGLVTGLGATGFHEMLGMFSPSKKAEAAAGKAVADAFIKGDSAAGEAVAVKLSELDTSAHSTQNEKANALTVAMTTPPLPPA